MIRITILACRLVCACIVLHGFFLFSSAVTAAPKAGDECGRPQIDRTTERGIYIWKDCIKEKWTVIASADARALPVLNYKGVVSASKPFNSFNSFNLEPRDSVVNYSARAQIEFDMSASAYGRDWFTFGLPSGMQACINVTDLPQGTRVYLGAEKIKISKSLNLQTLRACYNFVFFLMDDMRWNTMFAMPITKEKLGSRAVEFTNAFITTPLCCPSRANILTGGFYSYNTGVLQVTPNIGSEAKFRENNDHNTIATKLQRAGYKTIFAGGKYLNGYKEPYIPPGWTKFVNNVLGPSLSNWFKYEVVTGSSPHFRSTIGEVTEVDQYVTSYHKDQVVDFIQNTDNSPFMAMFSVFAPHYPATPDKQDQNRFVNYKFRDRGVNEVDLSDKPQWVIDPDRARHVKSESKLASQFPLPGKTDVCGKPDVDFSMERGIYIWKNCVNNQWSVIATAGGRTTALTTYKGELRSEKPLVDVSEINIEANDSVDHTTDSKKISFSMNMQGSARDGFKFSHISDSQSCFDVTMLPTESQVYIGKNKMPLNAALNLTTLQPCFDDEFHIKQLQSLQSVDRAIGEIVDQVAAQGKLKDTVFVFMSDNGYLWGEHGLYKKAMAYDEAIRTPLLVVMPDVQKRKEHNMVAADLDVPAMFLDVAGVKHQTDGDSLAVLLKNSNVPWKSELYFQHWGGSEGAFGTWSALRNRDYKYVKNALGEIELYDMKNDPFELESLHDNPSYQSMINQMDTRLESQRGLAILAPWRASKGTVGMPYRFKLHAAGGKKPYRWRISEGALPNGLNLNPFTGEIQGTPVVAGEFEVKFMITDSSVARHSGKSQYDVRPPSGFYTIEIKP